MKERKTDDDLILKMLKESKTQKQIAEYFGVSPVAIHKRVKRLLPPPESLQKLTEKEQKFCIEKAKGKSNIQAVMSSYEVTSRESAKVMGSQLMKKPEIQMAISELMEYHGIGRSYRVQKLGEHIRHPDPNVSLKGLEQSWRLDGYVEKHVHVDMNYEDLQRQLKLIRTKKKELLRQIVESCRKEGMTDDEIIKKLIDIGGSVEEEIKN
jgi:hypothetical protein